MASIHSVMQPARHGRPCASRRAPARQLRTLAVLSRPEQQSQTSPEASTSLPRRQQLLSGAAAVFAAAALCAACSPAAAVAAAPTAFLSSTGGKGLLAEEEQRLVELRVAKEGEVRREIEAERLKLEDEARTSQMGKLCATPFGIDIVGITEVVALIGALVGGITARQRKAELEKLNEQLRKINMGLRQQARAGTMYAPGLSYVPPRGPPARGPAPLPDAGAGGGAAAAAAAAAPSPPSLASASVLTLPPEAPAARGAVSVAVNGNGATALNAAGVVAAANVSTILSMEEDELTADQVQCRDALRAGKRLLKDSNGAAAMVRFEKALMLSKALRDKVQERRAVRGLAAAARLQGQHRTAIKNLERVLEISREMREYTGDADAYGVIADCYTDLGEFETAAAFYDRYIDAMSKDQAV